MLDGADTVVELVGGDAVYAFVGHGHGSIGFKSGGAEHGYEHAGFVFADSAAVGEVHLGIVEGVAFAGSHADSGIADVVGHPVGEDGDAVVFVGGGGEEFVDFGLYFGSGDEAAVVFVHVVEPDGFGLPVGAGAEEEFGLDVVVGEGAGFAFEGGDVVFGEGVDGAVAFHGAIDGDVALRGVAAVVESEAEVFVGEDADLVDFLVDGVVAPEGDNVVEMAAHGGDVFVVVVFGEEGVGETFAVGDEFDFIAGVEVTYFDHFLAGTPVDEASRGDVVIDAQKNVLGGAVEMVEENLTEFDVGRKGVVVDFDGSEVAAAVEVVGADALVVDDVAEAGFLHDNGGAVVEDSFVLGVDGECQENQHDGDE